jgi:UDP-N-acetylglucosamine:LPS N-acetylglucosamine transferase
MKICLVGSGGHLTQILQLMDAFEGYETFFVTYNSETTKNLKNTYLIKHYGERNIHLFLMMINITLKAFSILIKEKPDVIVSTGAEIAIPICYIGKFMGKKIIYIESLSRIRTRSGTGKIIYPIADLFLVQWQSLLKRYGKKAQYWGKVI